MSSSGLEDLQDDLLFVIFSFLPAQTVWWSLSQVSRRLAAAVGGFEPLTISWHKCGNAAVQGLLQRIGRSKTPLCSSLTKLSFSQCHVVDEAIGLLVAEAHGLEKLSFSQCPLLGENITAKFANLNKLQQLELKGMDHLLNIDLSCLSSMSKLQLLDFSGSCNISDQSLLTLARGARSGNRLTSTGLKSDSNSNSSAVTPSSVTSAPSESKAVATSASWRPALPQGSGKSRPSVFGLIHSQTFSTPLSPSSSSAMSLPLKTLNLLGCARISAASLTAVFPVLPHLKAVFLGQTKCNDLSMTALCLSCPNMEEIDLSDTIITDVSLATLAALRKLKSLSLINCDQLTSEGLESLAQISSSMTSLRLDGCVQLTSSNLHSFSHLTQLKVLSISRCARVEDVGLQALTTLAELKFLALRKCDRLSVQVVEKMIESYWRKVEVVVMPN